MVEHGKSLQSVGQSAYERHYQMLPGSGNDFCCQLSGHCFHGAADLPAGAYLETSCTGLCALFCGAGFQSAFFQPAYGADVQLSSDQLSSGGVFAFLYPDVYGFVEAIPKEIQDEIKGKEIAILGNGGAARAVAVGLSILKVKKLDFFVRNIINAAEMIEMIRRNFPEVEMNCYQIDSLKNLSQYKMLVNTTPIGMKSKAMGISPIDERIVKTLPADAIVYDLVYNPLKTELIRIAKKSGIRTIHGLDMLIYQGAKAFELWTGKKPDIQQMKIAALEEMCD